MIALSDKNPIFKYDINVFMLPVSLYVCINIDTPFFHVCK